MKAIDDEFVSLVQSHRDTIYAVCYMFSDSREDVQDLFQEVLLKLWKGFKTFRSESDIRTWIYRVSLNCCINAQKKSSKEAKNTRLDFDIPDSQQEKGMQVEILYKRINKLGYFDRAIIMLWLEGLSYDEIADIVGISVKNVSWRLVQIKNQLKNS